MSWYKITANDWTIQDEFLPIWMANGGPKDAALFAAPDLRTRTIDFYFSPAAAKIATELIDAHAAVECLRPDIARLVLAVGDQAATEGSC